MMSTFKKGDEMKHDKFTDIKGYQSNMSAQDKATHWTHENDCIVNDPVTNKPMTGYRLYDDGYLIGELYKMDESDKYKLLKAVNLHDELIEALENAREFILRFDEQDESEIAASKAISDALQKARGEA